MGKVTAEKMNNLGIHTGADLKNWTLQDLIRHFGKSGKYYFERVRGIDNREVQTHRKIKSISVEDTFSKDLIHYDDLILELEKLSAKLAVRIKAKNKQGKTLTLKVKFGDFTQITRNQSFESYVSDEETIYKTALMLLQNLSPNNQRSIRLLGITLSNFPDNNLLSNNEQLTLFNKDF